MLLCSIASLGRDPETPVISCAAEMANSGNAQNSDIVPRTKDRSVPVVIPWKYTVLYLRARRSVLICQYWLLQTDFVDIVRCR